jgi:hypothetical protein
VLVGIERADRLAEHLADAVAAVRARGHVGADAVMARIEADRMVRRGEHDALDALFARGLEQIVAADDVGLQDVVPGPFDRIAAEMQDAVDAFADRLDLREIGEVGRLEFLVLAEIGGRFQIAEQQVRIDRRQQLAQARADSAGAPVINMRGISSLVLILRPICGPASSGWPPAALGEGPVWFGDGRYLLWSDIPNNRILKWEEETGAVSVFRKPSNFANGNTRDRQGRLSPASMAAAASPAPNMTARSRC